MDTSQPIQHTSPDAAWVKTQVVEAAIDELSKVSLVDAATIIRAAVKGQPIDVAPVARLAVLRPAPGRPITVRWGRWWSGAPRVTNRCSPSLSPQGPAADDGRPAHHPAAHS